MTNATVQVLDHELYSDLEPTLDAAGISEEFLNAKPEQTQKLLNAMNTLQTTISDVEAEAEDWAAEKDQEDEEEDED